MKYAGKNVKNPNDPFWVEINQKVEAKVKQVVDKLKISHEKFSDPDFGPNDKDQFGSLLFRSHISISPR